MKVDFLSQKERLFCRLQLVLKLSFYLNRKHSPLRGIKKNCQELAVETGLAFVRRANQSVVDDIKLIIILCLKKAIDSLVQYHFLVKWFGHLKIQVRERKILGGSILF